MKLSYTGSRWAIFLIVLSILLFIGGMLLIDWIYPYG
jgi:hypothetical protein